jgi:uncharacterized protein (TIGR02444 family)
MSLWDWSLEAYARPGVAEACLELQDRHGHSVPYLLWAAWAARHGRTLSLAPLTAGADLARTWEEIAVGPLRHVRRQLKASIGGIEAQAVRDQVKAAELAAERALMLALEAMTPAPDGQAIPLTGALIAAAAVWDPALAPLALHDLAQKLA